MNTLEKFPVNLPGIRNITISSRIGCGSTTLAHNLATILQWKVIDGGGLFRAFSQDHAYPKDRPDSVDLEFDNKFKNIIQKESHHIIQSHLAGFLAQGVNGVYKILLVCEDEEGNDNPNIRAQRLVNRDAMSFKDAIHEVVEREKQHLEKWRRLYVSNDPKWVYWRKDYYDIVINTYYHNQQQTLQKALKAIQYT